MPMLVTINGYHGTQNIDEYLAFGPKHEKGHIQTMQDYLAGNGGTRALQFGHSCHFNNNQYGWSAIMEATRKKWRKDVMPQWFIDRYGSAEEAGRHWRDYTQFIISPDPRDNANAKDVAELARQWCQKNFPDKEGYQWIYSVHADNENGIMHAHVILNAVNDKTGRKVHITDGKAISLARNLQTIAPELGMSQMQDIVAQRLGERTEYRGIEKTPRLRRDQKTNQPEKISAAERNLVARGQRSWIHEIRVAVNNAAAEANGFFNFVALCEKQGIMVEWSRNGIGFRNSESMKALGCSLGSAYTEEGIKARLGQLFDGETTRWRKPARTKTYTRYQVIGMELRALGIKASYDTTPATLADRLEDNPRWTHNKPKDVIASIATIRKYNITSREGLRRAIEEQSAIAADKYKYASELQTSLDQTQKAFDAAVAARDAKVKLAQLPDVRFWDTETRRKRNELENALTEQTEIAQSILAKADTWLQENGYGNWSDLDKAVMLRSNFIKLSEKATEESNNDAKKLQELMQSYETVQKAINTTTYTQGRAYIPKTTYTPAGSSSKKLKGYAPTILRRSVRRMNTSFGYMQRYATQMYGDTGPSGYGAATERQLNYIADLVEKGKISQEVADRLGTHPTAKAANEFLNNRVEVLDITWKTT